MKFFQFLLIFVALNLLAVGQQKPGWLTSELSPAKSAEWLSQPGASRATRDAIFSPPAAVSDQEAASSLARKSLPPAAALSQNLTTLNLTTPGGNEADFVTPEIEALARGLRNDPVKIYEYVHNYIKFEAYFGSKKGAHLTLLEASGNEHDQSALLVSLLRAAGLSPTYKYGPCSFVYAQMASWYGISTSPFAHWTDAQLLAYYYPAGGAPVGFPSANFRQKLTIYEFLTPKGYPYIDVFDSSGVTFYSIPHVWVELDGKKLSPALKYHTVRSGINLAAATGYSRSQILSDAGGTVNPDGGSRWVSGIDYPSLASRLTSYTQNFTQAVKSTADWRHPDRITEATTINKQSYTTLDDAEKIFPDDFAAGQWLPYETWSAIPTVHLSKLEIQAGIWNGSNWTSTYFNQTVNLAGLRGRKLSLSYVGNSARIHLDETLVGGSAFTVPAGQTSMDLKLGVNHNHYEIVYQSGAYSVTNSEKSNQSETKKYQVGSDSAYAIIYSFSNPDLHSRAHQDKLDTYLRSGLTDSDWRVRTESLNLMGLNWLHQCYLADQVTAGLYSVIPLHHHQFGRVGQEPSFAVNQQSFYIDAGLLFSANSHRTMNFADELNFAYLSNTFGSAMEHGVLEQMQGVGLGATSTVKMVYLANQEAQPLYRATAANWSLVSQELLNYPASSVASVGNALSANNLSRALLPRGGQITLNQYKGFGYALEEPTRVSMLIGSNFGGYNSQPGSASSAPIVISNTSNPAHSASSTQLSISNVPQNLPQVRFNDPVDVLSGAFVMDATDLVLGSGAAPEGLQFSRSYNSNSRFNLAPGLGYGWTHDSDITATRRSSVKAGLGSTNTYQAAPFFAALAVASDLSRNHTTAKEWATAALAIHWAVDQLKYKAVAISQGNRTYEFIEMPDGSYVSPAGSKLTLIKNGAGNFELTQRHGSTMFFRSDGKIDHITDLFGKTQQYTYDAGNQLTQVRDAYNREINFTWTGSKITNITDTTGRSVGFSYTGDDLTTVTDVEGKTMTYLYDAEHRIIQIKDALNRTTIENDYDANSRVISQRNQGDPSKFYQIYYTGYANTEQNPAGGTTTHLYDDRGRVIGSKDALGNADTTIYDGQDRRISYLSPKVEITDWDYNSDHNLTQENDPKGKITDYFYNSQLRLQRVNDKRGKDTTFTYNSAHQLLNLTDPLANVITNQYQVNGLLSTITDAENKTTSFTYDSWGQVNRITYPDSKFQTFINDARGNVLSTTDPENRTTTTTYNKRRQPLTSTLPTIAGEPLAVTSQTYDDAGNPLTSTDAKGNLTHYNYNSLANPLTTTLPALATGTNIITSTYDSRDWRTTTTNSLSQTATTEYDAAHRPTAVIDPLNRRIENQYDANGQVTQAKDPLNRITKQVWNVRGEKERGTDALNKNTDFLYDNNGNLTKLTNRRGKFYQSVFDSANRTTSTSTPTGKVTLMTYFNNNQIKTLREPSLQTTTLTYNARNLVETKVDPTGTVTYGYDASTLLKTVTEGSTVISRTYDGRGRLKTFTTADGDLIQYQYDANNNLTRLTYPDGKQVNYTYNARNLLATVTDWSNRVTTYTYDRLGKLTGTTRPNGTSNQIAHDAASQLTFVKEYSGTQVISYLAFKYDAAGQIQSRFRAPLVNSGWQHPALTATYDDDNRLLTANGQPVTHDADGNMTRSVGILPTSLSTAVDLTYNSRNQLTSAAGLSYTYDAEGCRRTLTDSGGTTRDAIDPSGKLLVRTHPNNTKTYYVYGHGLLYEANQAGTTKTYHYDQVGSTLARTDNTGKVIGRAEYSAYGLTTYQQGDMATPFLYNGQAGVQTDPNGLLHMRARYYSPYLCRFLNADPIGFSGGSNWFAYADGNPISKSDPFGLCAQGGFNAARGAVGEYMGGYASSMWGNAGNFLKSANPIAAIYNSPQTARAGLQAISSPIQTANNAIDNVANTWNSGPSGIGQIMGTVAFNLITAAAGGGGGGTAANTMDSAVIRFSQNSISRNFSAGGTIDDLAAGLRSGNINPASIPPIRLVESEGNMFTLDNRRLWSFQQAETPIPYRMATSQEASAEAWKFTTTNGGSSVRIR